MSAAEPRAGAARRDVALAALRAAWWRGGLLLLAFLCGLPAHSRQPGTRVICRSDVRS